MLRLLKHEATNVKILYLGVFTAIASGGTMLCVPGQWITPDVKQSAILLLCGAHLPGTWQQALVASQWRVCSMTYSVRAFECTVALTLCKAGAIFTDACPASLYALSVAACSSPVCASAGASGLLVQILLTKGLELADAAKAMTMAYSSIVWAELAGTLLFREYANVWSLLGITIIIGGTTVV
jgi:drug/metabolite transporter (DMT)-like permease